MNGNPNLKDIFNALAAPFHPKDIEWRAGATNADKTKAMALAYITSRAVMDRLDEVMSLDRKGTGVHGEVASRKQVLPLPGSGCRGIFAGQGRGHGNRDFGVSLVETVHLSQMGVKALRE